MEHPLLLHQYLTNRSTYQGSHAEELSYNSTYPTYSTARSGETELTAPYPESDEYDASGEDNDEDGRGGRGGFRRVSPPSKIDLPVAVACRDPPKSAATAAETKTLGSTVASNKPPRGIKRIPDVVKSAHGLSALSNFNTTCQLQRCNCIKDGANVREKKIAPQLELMARNLRACVVRKAVLHVHRTEESTRDHSSSDPLDETVDEDGNEGDDEDCDEDSDESGDEDRNKDWFIVDTEGKEI
ncbi:hypothetical protein HOY82DRAFT_566719 [Tuber indicum]|nr:hypothetical protein HOY82DRAFT_566719 [Tuber indicum]